MNNLENLRNEYGKVQDKFLDSYTRLHKQGGDRFLESVAEHHLFVQRKIRDAVKKELLGEEDKIQKGKDTVARRISNYKSHRRGEESYSRVVNLDDIYAVCIAGNMTPNDILWEDTIGSQQIKDTDDVFVFLKNNVVNTRAEIYEIEKFKGKKWTRVLLPNSSLFINRFLFCLMNDFLRYVKLNKSKNTNTNELKFFYSRKDGGRPDLYSYNENGLKIEENFEQSCREHLIKLYPENEREKKRNQMERYFDSHLYFTLNLNDSNKGRYSDDFKKYYLYDTYIEKLYFAILLSVSLYTITNMCIENAISVEEFLKDNENIAIFLVNLYEASTLKASQNLVYNCRGESIINGYEEDDFIEKETEEIYVTIEKRKKSVLDNILPKEHAGSSSR